jgi:hypothetical protein
MLGHGLNDFGVLTSQIFIVSGSVSNRNPLDDVAGDLLLPAFTIRSFQPSLRSSRASLRLS